MEGVNNGNRLKYFPITMFATVMGLTGLAIVFLRFDHLYKVDTEIGKYLLYLITI